MAAGRIVIPNYMPCLDINGAPVAGAKLYFYLSQTTDLQSVYTDATLTVAHTNPVIADAAGVFPSIFADITAIYSVSIRTADDVPIGGLRDVDNIQASESQNAKVDLTGDNVVGGYVDALLAALGLNVRIAIIPEKYGAVGDGVTDDAGAWNNALTVAATLGLPVDGRNKTYGVGNVGATAAVQAPRDSVVMNANFKHITPNTGISGGTNSRVIECDGGGSGTFTMMNVTIDRNGGSVSTTLYPNQGVRALNLGRVNLLDVEVFGNNAGECIKLDTVKIFVADVYIHDAKYVHSAQTNDTVEGLTMSDVEKAYGNVTIARLGRTDQTSIERYRLSRGLTLDRVSGGALDVDISCVEQGADYSGYGSSRVKLRGKVYRCFTNGVKLAHAHQADCISDLTIEHIGRNPVLIAGPNDGEALPFQRDVRVTALSIYETGSNGYWQGIGAVTAGVSIERNSASAVRNAYPQNVVVEGNVITSYTGSVVVTRSGNTLVAADGSFPLGTCKPVTFSTTGTLPAPLAAATTYWQIWDEVSLSVQVASSYNNAEDGVFISLTTAGTGVHTMTGKSFMSYRGLVDANAVKSLTNPNVFRNNSGSGATVADYSGFSDPWAIIPTNATQAVVDSGTTAWVTLKPTGVGKTDTMGLYDASTGAITVPFDGVWRFSSESQIETNGTGVRRNRITVNGSAVDFLRNITPPSSVEATIQNEVTAFFSAGTVLKSELSQNSSATLAVSTTLRLTYIGGGKL